MTMITIKISISPMQEINNRFNKSICNTNNTSSNTQHLYLIQLILIQKKIKTTVMTRFVNIQYAASESPMAITMESLIKPKSFIDIA